MFSPLIPSAHQETPSVDLDHPNEHRIGLGHDLISRCRFFIKILESTEDSSEIPIENLIKIGHFL